MKISEDFYKQISDLTGTEYEFYKKDNMLMIDDYNSYCMIENLIDVIYNQKEELEEMEKNINENYIPVRYDPYDEYGVSEKDFF